MNLLLDTTAYSALHRGDTRILAVLRRATRVSVPVVVLGELHSGFRSGPRRLEKEELLRRFLG